MAVTASFEAEQIDQMCVEVESSDIPKKSKAQILYKVEDKPPLFLSILLGFQQYITMYGGAVAYPFVVSNLICMAPDDPNRGYLMQTVFFTSGLATLVQVIYGTRLPLIQGASFGFLIPFLAMADLPENRCPSPEIMANMTKVEYDEVWTTRMRVIQGSILLGGFAEILVGIFGLMGYMLKFISPVIIGPTIIQLGLSLSQVAMKEASANWIFSMGTILLLILFTLYMEHVYIPFPNLLRKYHERKNLNQLEQLQKSTVKVHLFKLFPVLLTIITIWLISFVCTEFDWIAPGDPARTDGDKSKLIHDSPFFRIPLPFQWGWPMISTSAVIGVFCAVLISIFESVGDYFACSKLCEAPSPPKEVINRGIVTEGIGCIFAGIFGTGGGVTSYSENIGAIAITKVGSRQVIIVSAIIMLIVSFFVKLSALLATIPAPIIGGILAILCGIITAVGISIIKFVNLDNTRNLFIVGVSTFCGLSFPAWFKDHPEQIQFGGDAINRLATVLIRNPMFVTGVLAFFLDNTIRGATAEDRGMTNWINLANDDDDSENNSTCIDSASGKDFDSNNNGEKSKIKQNHSDATIKRVYSLPRHCDALNFLGNWFPICMPK